MWKKVQEACRFDKEPGKATPTSSEVVDAYAKHVANVLSQADEGLESPDAMVEEPRSFAGIVNNVRKNVTARFQAAISRQPERPTPLESAQQDATSLHTEDTAPVPTFDDEPVIPLRYTVNVNQLQHTNWFKRFFGWPFGWRERYTAEVSLGDDTDTVIFRYSDLKSAYKDLKEESPELYTEEFPDKPSSHSERVEDMHNIFNDFFEDNPDVTQALFPIDDKKSLLSVLKEMKEEHEQLPGPVKVALIEFEKYAKQQDVNDEMSQRMSRIVHKFKTVTLMVVEKFSSLETFVNDMSEILGESQLLMDVQSQVGLLRGDFDEFFNYLAVHAQASDWDSLSKVLVWNIAKEDPEAFQLNHNLTEFRERFSVDNKQKMIHLVELQDKVWSQLIALCPQKIGAESEHERFKQNDLINFLGQKLDWHHVAGSDNFSNYSKFSQPETWPQTRDLDHKIEQLTKFLESMAILSDNEDAMQKLLDLQPAVWLSLENRCSDKIGHGSKCFPVEALERFLGKTMLLKHFRENLNINDRSTWPQPSFGEHLQDKIEELEDVSHLGQESAQNVHRRTEKLVERIMQS